MPKLMIDLDAIKISETKLKYELAAWGYDAKQLTRHQADMAAKKPTLKDCVEVLPYAKLVYEA